MDKEGRKRNSKVVGDKQEVEENRHQQCVRDCWMWMRVKFVN